MVISKSEPVVVIRSITGKNKNGGLYGLLEVRPIRDREKLSMPVPTWCNPPTVASEINEGDVLVLDLLTQVTVSGGNARSETVCTGFAQASTAVKAA